MWLKLKLIQLIDVELLHGVIVRHWVLVLCLNVQGLVGPIRRGARLGTLLVLAVGLRRGRIRRRCTYA